MPGKNCAFPGCGVSCSRKYKGISIFQIPMRNDEFHSNWRKEIVNVLFKYRVADKELKDRVAVGKIYICERHFSTDDIELTKNKRKTLKLLAIPTKNLPKKSHEKSQHPGRKHQHIVQDRASDKILNSKCYKSFLEFKNRANKLKLTDNWMVTHHERTRSFKKFTKPFLVPTYEIIVDESLVYSCVVLGWVLQSDHYFIKQYLGSVKNVFISDLITEIENFKVCLGLTNITSSELICHYVSTEISLTGLQAGLSVHKHYLRPKNCDILCSLLSENNICSKCSNFEKKFYKQLAQKNKTSTVPAKKNAPLKSTHPNKIILALKEKRLECKELTKTIEKIKNEIVSKSIAVPSNISDEVFEIMRLDNNEVSPFMKMLWKQQQIFFSNPTSKMRYHPMIIRFCLSLAMKSASAYDELRSAKILKFPSLRTLRDYKNAIKPCVGFNTSVIDELLHKTSNLIGYQRFVCLSFDEIKIQEDLVFDKFTNELIGYVDLGDPNINYSTFPNSSALATHALIYYLRGIASDLKFSLAYFATKGVTSNQLMMTFWKAVSILELTCDLYVIAAVSDGASTNRKFYRMHKMMDGLVDNEVTYRTINLFANDRFIWFFADAPHLIKTLRNCLYHSGLSGTFTRHMWNGNDIIWYHFKKLYNDELERSLKLIPKLTSDHFNLSPFSVMNVRLATQVLSETVSNVIESYYPAYMHKTAELCKFADKFFDCMNVRNHSECLTKRKPFLEPYKNVNDERFTWLKENFLNYLKLWKENVSKRVGDFSNDERERMFLSSQTYEGLRITSYSLIEVTKYLLNTGMPYVLSERFNQDVLEEHFGRHRSLGRRNDNPTIHQFGYQSNTLRMQRSVVPVTGNTKGAHKTKRVPSWTIVDETPLKKR